MTEVTTENTQNNITLQDLGLVVQIIDTCTKRGAFEGVELSSVGMLRDKVDAFVRAHIPQQTKEQTEETAEEMVAEEVSAES